MSLSVSLRTIRRAELADHHTTLTIPNDLAIRRALEAAGIEFIDENGGIRRRCFSGSVDTAERRYTIGKQHGGRACPEHTYLIE
jgi:hypothetical protein